jgi:hypothetical protein
MKENADEEWYLKAYAYGNGPRFLNERLAKGKRIYLHNHNYDGKCTRGCYLQEGPMPEE